jgi:hypothetical protein
MSANPYAAPNSALEVAESPPAGPTVRSRTLKSLAWLGGSMAAGVGAFFVALANATPLGTVAFLAAAAVALVGLVTGARGLALAAKADGAGTGIVALGVLATLANLGMTLLGAFAAFLSTLTFSRGRQLRRRGEVLLPPLARGEAWAAKPAPPTGVEGLEALDADDATRAALAARWRENARTEHASVAAFARLTLDLVGLGAPPELVAAAQRDALDEIAHAQACFAIARALDGVDVGPGPFPQAARARTLSGGRTLALAQLAVDSLVDGALHEGVSARVIARLARRCEVAPIAATLKRIAADEGRHAAHGWDVVEWCIAEGGPAIAAALRGALRALPATMRTPLPEPAGTGAWERWGIHGHALEAAEYARTRAYVTARVARLSSARASSAARAGEYTAMA